MNPDTGVVHVRPDEMDDDTWNRQVEREKLVPLPGNRTTQRAADTLARASSRHRGFNLPQPPPRSFRRSR